MYSETVLYFFVDIFERLPMKSGQLSNIEFLTIPTVKSALDLTAIDHLFLNQINEFHLENNNKKIIDLIKGANLEAIIRMAHTNPSFACVCRQAELNEYWGELWCAYGVVLASHQSLPPILFYAYSGGANFDLVCGAYFFHLSQVVKDKLKDDFSYSEKEFLKFAIKKRSVHAIQRYNEFLFEKIKEASNVDDKNKIYNKIIENTKLSLPQSGTYGYLMLADVLSQYSFFLVEQNKFTQAKRIHRSALECTRRADTVFIESEFSILNASLGRGLQLSNRFNTSIPNEMKELLISEFNYLDIKVGIKNSENTVIPFRKHF